MILSLMLARRFAPLFWSQFFSAFNDNLVRNMLAMMILFKVGQDNAGPLVTLALGIFILPSIVLSGLGGELADSHDKARVAWWLKVAELGVQAIAATGFWFTSIVMLYVALFLLGVIATLYTPVKYGILPDHLRRSELTVGNAFVEGASFVAILLGLAAGGMTGLQSTSKESVVLQLIGVALACLACTWFIPPTPAAAPDLRISRNLLKSTFSLIRDIRRDARLWVGSVGSSWFWLSGSVTLVLVPVVVKQRIGGGVEVETAISVFFAIGVGDRGPAGRLVVARPHHHPARPLGGRLHGHLPDRHGDRDPLARNVARRLVAGRLPPQRDGVAALVRPHRSSPARAACFPFHSSRPSSPGHRPIAALASWRASACSMPFTSFWARP